MDDGLAVVGKAGVGRRDVVCVGCVGCVGVVGSSVVPRFHHHHLFSVDSVG